MTNIFRILLKATLAQIFSQQPALANNDYFVSTEQSPAFASPCDVYKAHRYIANVFSIGSETGAMSDNMARSPERPIITTLHKKNQGRCTSLTEAGLLSELLTDEYN